ncbi:Cytoskeleton protein RodZ [Cupriavidus yeoncheonensis]|uniref:Cytoskeleton protein RodZ n=1 Tax=Cupriavidus yeoncheonensis TaxID=1462994 RepID=A0A916NBT7_9BURK|nr:RodZ domain-containing protein [Cupriavidus yeoncheonensis]CAG2126653.1 Cytoskeleton protein RodZ [Cupriavidus yeoncheonensis]
MSEQERAAGQAASTGHVGGGATDSEREAVAREIGALLAQARQSQRLSIEDVSARLKVAAPKLAAVETGHLDALPDVTFAKGVMRAYARILHVDVDALLARFQPRPVQVTEMARQREGGINQTFDDRRRFGTRSGAGAGGRWVWLALVAAGVAAGGWFGLDHMKQWLEARNSTAQVTQAEAQEQPAQASDSGTVTAALPPVMAGADSPAPSEALPASAPAASASDAAVPVPAAAAAPIAATVTATVTAPVAPAVATAPAAPAVAGSAQGELQIKFASDTWYEIRDRNGKVVLGGTAKGGQEVSGGGAAPYKVIIGNVKGVESMSRNGTPVDLKAANRNNVARLTLP